MKRIPLILLMFTICIALFAQDYNVAMPGQKKVTKTDEQGNQTTQIVTDDNSDFIQYRGNSWYYKGQTMNEEEFKDMMQRECPAAYKKFQESVSKKKTGYVLAGVGGGAMVLGSAFMIWGATQAEYIKTNCYGYTCDAYLEWNWQMISGLCMLIGGGAVFVGGMVVILQTAPDCKRKAHHIYNKQCAQPATDNTPVALKAGFTSDEIGLALTF